MKSLLSQIKSFFSEKSLQHKAEVDLALDDRLLTPAGMRKRHNWLLKEGGLPFFNGTKVLELLEFLTFRLLAGVLECVEALSEDAAKKKGSKFCSKFKHGLLKQFCLQLVDEAISIIARAVQKCGKPIKGSANASQHWHIRPQCLRESSKVEAGKYSRVLRLV